MDLCYITVWINAYNHTPITVVNFRQNSKLLILSIIPEVFNFECHNLLFLGGYIPLESLTKLCDISGRTHDIHEQVIGQIHPFFLSKFDKSMRTSRINRCVPRYAGTEFTNRGITEACIRKAEAYIRLRKRVIRKRISDIRHLQMRYHLDLVKLVARYDVIIAWYEIIITWYAIIITLYEILKRNNAIIISRNAIIKF